MSWMLALAIGAVLAAGVFLLLSRSVLRVVIGVSLIGSAANLMLFTAGRVGTGSPPVIEKGLEALVDGSNPLPQALVLTAIVIGFALTCFSLVLALSVKQETGEGDTDELRDAEPPAGDDGKPAILEDARR
ncbi:Na+/H+ antiporter subunit C [Alkalisalibacterium limincola]|uniref:Na+/H+ antiporter subunit C n=1 Tax=Alkalisalibacterium limincola TaxID=2699169 RepID=A0A5C8KY29_9GAMM|nr:Na+/H+ antiporter subunit C [Alkalisalibacterium limincola]TXK64944.1 Na+/H+ antiporter subunit C [Alkalisalibacterium limincola]